MTDTDSEKRISADLCRGLIEALHTAALVGTAYSGFPRLYAAASLKPPIDGAEERADQ